MKPFDCVDHGPSQVVKNLPANAGDLIYKVSILGSGRFPGVGNGNPLHYSCLENSMDRGAWQATVHRVTKIRHAWSNLGQDSIDHNKLWKILKELGIPEHFTFLLRNLYTGQEATIWTRQGTTDWFKIGKELWQGCILSPCLFNLYAEYICDMLGWMKLKLESRLPGEISVISDMQMTPP